MNNKINGAIQMGPLPEVIADDHPDSRIADQVRVRFRLGGYTPLMVELRLALVRWKQRQAQCEPTVSAAPAEARAARHA